MQYSSFSNIKISTQTIIALSNMTFDLTPIYKYLPVTDYVVVKRKRGRKRRVEVVNPNRDVPAGSIISVQNKTNIRGITIKKQKESKTYFLNSLTLVVVLESGKLINVKITKNGKFQITGCKNDSHFMKCVEYVYKNIIESERVTGEKLFSFKDGSTTPKIIFNIVMKNIDFKLGFSIEREKLDTFISQYTNFTSYYDGSITTGVNIKIKSGTPYDSRLKCIELMQDNSIKSYMVDYSEYFNLLDDKEQKKEQKKKKYHTFLVFCSGSVIQSGSGPEMEIVYNDFMNILLENQPQFEERLNTANFV